MRFPHLRNIRGFFSDYYLGSVFGYGRGRGARRQLSDRDSARAYRRFLLIYERAEGRADDRAACRERLIRPLLRDVLGMHLGPGTDRIHRVHVSAAAEAEGAAPLLLAWCGAWADDLDPPGTRSPRRQVEDALARESLPYAFLITGERMRLVRSPGEGPRGAYLEVALNGLAEQEEPESFAAFLRLFSASSFVPDASGTAPIVRVDEESRRHAEQVSQDLKQAVFASAETLVCGLLDDARRRGVLVSDPPADDAVRAYRDAALTALYRMLFILYAEDRDPRLEEHRLYRESYSLHGALEEVLRHPARAWPGNRCGLWRRMQALFRIYDEGLPAISPWEHLPPRGGDFFSRQTAPGRILAEADVPDSVMAGLLVDLATGTPRRGVGRERVSFRELDIENLGSVYEGLLEFEPRVEAATSIELRVQGRVFSLAPEEVVRLCDMKRLTLKGDLSIVAGTAAERLHPEAPDDPTEDDEPEDLPDDSGEDADETETDEGEEGEGDEGVRRGATARLVRRLDAGQFHFVPSSSRKGSGSFYTPIELVQDLVRHAVGPLVEGRRSQEVEAIRVLDPACGSAHFLVEAMRFLGRALHRAYVEEHGNAPPVGFRPTRGLGWDRDWEASDAEARAANSEARAWCKRRIAERCLFGVDLNPTAVELARVALWIESLAGDRPLTFFAHHVRCGNSLFGTWLEGLRRPPLEALGKAPAGAQTDRIVDLVRSRLEEAARLRRLIDATSPDSLLAEGLEPESVGELDYKERLRRDAEKLLGDARLLFDLRAASALVPGIWPEFTGFARALTTFLEGGLSAWAEAQPWWPEFAAARARERFFHWELEYPEAFIGVERPGFDAVLGNPPWDKVLPSKKEFYARHDNLVQTLSGESLSDRIEELIGARPSLEPMHAADVARTRAFAQYLRNGGDFPLAEARSAAAHEDLSKYFVDRAARLVRAGGRAGLVVPSVLYNGDGCVGIRRFLLRDATIERFYGFENRSKIFPIDSRYKFVNLVFCKGGATDRFTAAFMRHDRLELAGEGPKPWMVEVTREEIERCSPETLAFLEYRSPRDREIVQRMYGTGVVLGGRGVGTWGVDLVSWRDHLITYNATEDRDLFTDPATGRLYSPASVLGREPGDPEETFRLMRQRGFWPVFEGKHVDQWLVGRKPIRWWLSVERAERKYGRAPRGEATLVFRETARNTDERTCIAAVLPPHSAASHTLTGALVEHVDPARAATVLNSLSFDYALRMRTAGTHVSFTYILPMPVPPADVVNRLPTIPVRFAPGDSRAHITKDRALWPSLWAANRAVAEAYGLDPDDFEHVLGSFPVMARKRAGFGQYLREQAAEWRRMREGEPTYPEMAPTAPLPAAADQPRKRKALTGRGSGLPGSRRA